MRMSDKITMRPVEALIPYARNAGTHSKAQVVDSPLEGDGFEPSVPRRDSVPGRDRPTMRSFGPDLYGAFPVKGLWPRGE